MSTRRKISKSVNTMKTAQATWMPKNPSQGSILHREIEELTNDTITTATATTSSDMRSTELDCPIPYTFRIYLPEGGTTLNHAKCPPFYMQLDHTIAVLWHVFAHGNKAYRKNIGISQLQWALYFLKGIKDPREGTRQADIDVAIKSIEDTLIECYAGMANLVKSKSQIKLESSDSNLVTIPVPKQINNIGTSASEGLAGKQQHTLFQPNIFNNSSFSFTTIGMNPDISSTLEELIRLRNVNKKSNIECPLQPLSITSTKDESTSAVNVNTAYEMFKQLHEDQVKKLNFEIENFKRIEEASSLTKYLKLFLKYCESLVLWSIINRIITVSVRLLLDQFRMDDIYANS